VLKFRKKFRRLKVNFRTSQTRDLTLGIVPSLAYCLKQDSGNYTHHVA